MNGILKKMLENAEQRGDKPAVVWRESQGEVTVCWRDFMAAVVSVGGWLKEIAGGRPLFLLSGNQYPWILVHMAVLCGDGLLAVLDPELPAETLALQMEKNGNGGGLCSTPAP